VNFGHSSCEFLVRLEGKGREGVVLVVGWHVCSGRSEWKFGGAQRINQSWLPRGFSCGFYYRYDGKVQTYDAEFGICEVRYDDGERHPMELLGGIFLY
jgi:hypothetical protein